jgi:hypothetical protein
LKLLVWVKIGYVKSIPNDEISPNLVTLLRGEANEEAKLLNNRN